MKRKIVLVVIGSLAMAFQAAVVATQPLTFEQRVKAQAAIERVYYAHRIWPKENPGPKPAFEQMVPRGVRNLTRGCSPFILLQGSDDEA